MTTLKTFSKSEDAYILATLLSSEGIDAVVVDDSSLGGNLLGATDQAIRIEVPEDQVEAAMEIATREPPIEPEPQVAAFQAGAWSRYWYFDALVLGDLALVLAIQLTPILSYDRLPLEVEKFLFGKVVSEFLWQVASDVHAGFTTSCCLASVMILFRLRLGRILYIGTLLWAGFTYLCYPPEILTPGGAFLMFFWNLIAGTIVAMMFLPPIRDEFRKRLTES